MYTINARNASFSVAPIDINVGLELPQMALLMPDNIAINTNITPRVLTTRTANRLLIGIKNLVIIPDSRLEHVTTEEQLHDIISEFDAHPRFFHNMNLYVADCDELIIRERSVADYRKHLSNSDTLHIWDGAVVPQEVKDSAWVMTYRDFLAHKWEGKKKPTQVVHFRGACMPMFVRMAHYDIIEAVIRNWSVRTALSAINHSAAMRKSRTIAF